MDCKNCNYKQNPDGGYCYMWKYRPKQCHYFKISKSVKKRAEVQNENR